MRKKVREQSVENVAQFLNYKVNDVTTGRGTGKEGELYGLELEVEGKNVQMEGKAVKGWRQVAENSLRGECVEYTFSAPCSYDEARTRVTRLFEAFTKAEVKLKNSYRCSTHVHINFADRPVKHVVNFFILYTIVEQLLEEYCGENRRGNVFCLSNRDVEPVVGYLQEAVLHNFSFRAFGDTIRYCGLNLSALNKFGSIEIRTMRGADDPQMVLSWMEILHNLWEFSRDMDPPVSLIEEMSFMGMDNWLRHVFTPDNYAKLIAAWPDDRNLQGTLYEGIRLVQILAYRLDEAYKTEVPAMPEGTKKTKRVRPRRGRDPRITNAHLMPRNLENVWRVPDVYVNGTHVRHIQPSVIIYNEEEDTWFEHTDSRGNVVIPPRAWMWLDDYREWDALRDAGEQGEEDEDSEPDFGEEADNE